VKAVELVDIHKKYSISHERRMLTKFMLLGWLKKNRESTLSALKDVNLSINKGEIVGIIGENGSGKTTLLRILSGVTAASGGMVEINGKVLSLLELGAGFHPDLTGRENIYLNGLLLGLSSREIDNKFQRIVDFAGLGNVIDTPIRTYSSGMYLRLGFSVAMSACPDILLIDEVLSVGDETFQKECVRKINELKDSGKTIVFVSHDLDMVLSLCDRVFLLNNGQIIKSGKPADVVEFYLDMTGKRGIAVLQKTPLDIVFNQGKFSLYWHGKKITKGIGGSTSLFIGKHWYPSTQAEWEVKSSNPDNMVVIGRWGKVGVVQEWRFSISEENSLKLLVTTECAQGILIEQEQMNLMISEKYKEWLADGEKNIFPKIPNNCTFWEDLLLRKPTLNCIAVYETGPEAVELPSICFSCTHARSDETIKVCNTDYQNNAHVLRYMSRAAKTKERFFNIELALDVPDINSYLGVKFEEKKQQVEKRRSIGFNESSIQKDSLKLIFEDGRARLFWDNTELTKELGLYSSVYSGNRWFESFSGEWNFKKTKNHSLRAVCRWHSLPIEQVWELDLMDNGLVSWKIDMVVYEQVIITQGRINVMLSEKYRQWFINQEREGDFPEILYDEWVDILDKNIFGKCAGVKTVSKDSLYLPRVDFGLSSNELNMVRISNTNICLNARVLQLLRLEPKDKTLFNPGTYSYFLSQLFINKDENIYH